MNKKNTEELENALGSTHVEDFSSFYEENRTSMMGSIEMFGVYMKECIKLHGMNQREVFLEADLPERYGYKLLSGEKKTRQRDVILRICYAAHFTLDETQHALREYQLPELYAKIPRDALLMIIFNERVGSILDVNALLMKHGMEPLRTSGLQD